VNNNVLNIEDYRILYQVFTSNVFKIIVKGNKESIFKNKLKTHFRTEKKITSNFEVLSENVFNSKK
jgi:hypothetical protein